jgi:hypothetical protein
MANPIEDKTGRCCSWMLATGSNTMNAVAMGRLDVCAAHVSAQVELGDGRRM